MNHPESKDPSHESMETRLRELNSHLREHVSLADTVADDLKRAGPHPDSPALPHHSQTSDDSNREFPGSQQHGSKLAILASGTLAASLLLCVYWFAIPASMSFADVKEKVEQVTSYSCSLTMVGVNQSTDRVPSWKVFWRAPHEHRIERRGDQNHDRIIFRDRPGIMIDHDAKTFLDWPAERGVTNPFRTPRDLVDFTENAIRNLGVKSINGRRCKGFLIKEQSVDPDAGPGSLEMWVDVETFFPVTIQTADGMLMSQFQWNVPLDDQLFSTIPPEGYSPQQPAMGPSDEEWLDKIVDALELFAELNDGRFPQVRVIRGSPQIAELMRLAGFDDPEALRSSQTFLAQRIGSTGEAWSLMSSLMRSDPLTTYHGLEVTSTEPNAILFRWHLNGDDYWVIYGDLSFEKISIKETEK